MISTVDLLKFQTEDFNNAIKNELNNVMNRFDFTKISINVKNQIDLKELKIANLEKHIQIWKEISRLTVDLFLEFDFFRTLIFENQTQDEIYHERLQNLGYKLIDNNWQYINNQKPDIKVVVENVFIFCFLNHLYRVRHESLSQCLYCDNELVNDECSICLTDYSSIP